MNAVERIIEYTQLPSGNFYVFFFIFFLEQSDIIVENNISPFWPESGKIEIKNLYVKHREELDFALKNINCKIENKEKIGIVGR